MGNGDEQATENVKVIVGGPGVFLQSGIYAVVDRRDGIDFLGFIKCVGCSKESVLVKESRDNTTGTGMRYILLSPEP